MKLRYFVDRFYSYFSTRILGARDPHDIFNTLSAEELTWAKDRAKYCCPLNPLAHRQSFTFYRDSERGTLQLSDLTFPFFAKGPRHSNSILDLFNTLAYFPRDLWVNYIFGDITEIPDIPTFVKSRPICPGNNNSVIVPLNTHRHFQWVDDTTPWIEKKSACVMRNLWANKKRADMLDKWHGNPHFDLGITGNFDGRPEWTVQPMTRQQQLGFRYIACIEGNDVATNLKWVMSSNSIALMPRPEFEIWFMEGRLKPDYHYLEVKPDYSDALEKIQWLDKNPSKADAIIANAHDWVSRFRNPRVELAAAILTASRYFHATGQQL